MAKINVTMDSDKMCIAFLKKKQFTLSASVNPEGNGTITGAGVYDKGSVIEVEALPNEDYDFDYWEINGVEIKLDIGFVLNYYDYNAYIDILIENGFSYLRMDIPDYANTEWLGYSKEFVVKAVNKGIKVIWGVSSNPTTITADNWTSFRQAILDAAQWAQDNGVYEFQIGNEEEGHIDGTTMTKAQLMSNLKSVATEVKQIFTNGNISYSCSDSLLDDWIAAGKGDIDILAFNVYRGGDGYYDDGWKTDITKSVNAFGVENTYITEFNISWSSLDDYSTDEAVQAAGLAEMIEYIRASGMKRAIFYNLKSNDFGAVKQDGTYRQLLWQALLNSGN